MINPIQKHIISILIVVMNIKLFVVLIVNTANQFRYGGENAVYKFMEKILKEVKYCKNLIKYKFNKPLKMTKEDESKFKKADSCHICNKKDTDKDIRVREHCHMTQKYRGSAHQDCNLKFRLTDKIPVIFHNLRGYDSHFIMQNIGQVAKTKNLKQKQKTEKNVK